MEKWPGEGLMDSIKALLEPCETACDFDYCMACVCACVLYCAVVCAWSVLNRPAGLAHKFAQLGGMGG